MRYLADILGSHERYEPRGRARERGVGDAMSTEAERERALDSLSMWVRLAMNAAVGVAPSASRTRLLQELQDAPEYLQQRIFAILDSALEQCSLEYRQWEMENAEAQVSEMADMFGSDSRPATLARARVMVAREELARDPRVKVDSRRGLRLVPKRPKAPVSGSRASKKAR